MRDSLRSSFGDEQAFHAEAVARLEGECATIQRRIDQMYLDKLDGVIDAAFFERHSTEWRAKQRALRHLAATLRHTCRILEVRRSEFGGARPLGSPPFLFGDPKGN